MPSYISIPSIKIGGADVSQEFMGNLRELVVENSLSLPSMFTLEISDPVFKWTDDSLVDFGKEVEIGIKPGGGTQSVILIKGEITAIEPHFSAEGNSYLVVRGYDKSHRLHRGKKTRSFLKVADSDIVSKIAGEAGVSPSVDSTGVIHDFVLQNNQTNMEFLMSRAERIGYQVYSAEGTLYFKKGNANLGSGPELTFAEDLLSFEPRYTTSGQTNKMKVTGWDPKQKKAITSEKTPDASLNQGGLGKTGGAAAQAAFSAAEAIVADRPVFTVDEAAAIATGLSQDISREFVEAEGICSGNPKVKAGYTVTLKKLGTRFSGKYLVTSVTHIYNPQGYETHFTISGRQPNTLSHLLGSGNGHGRGLIQGVVPAIVTNLKDPDDLGRVKVKYPWLSDQIESDWVRLASPMAGADRGLFYLPEVNDEVLVAFEHGDPHHPYIVGALWSSTEKSPKKNSEAVGSDGKVNQRVLKTRAGHLILFDDKQGEEQVAITSKSGHTFILNDKSGSESITIKDKTGNNSMAIDSTKNSMAIAVNGDFTVEAKGKVTIKSTQAMSLESQAAGSVKGMQLTLEGVSKAEVKAPTVSVAGSAMTEVKGGIVKIN